MEGRRLDPDFDISSHRSRRLAGSLDIRPRVVRIPLVFDRLALAHVQMSDAQRARPVDGVSSTRSKCLGARQQGWKVDDTKVLLADMVPWDCRGQLLKRFSAPERSRGPLEVPQARQECG